jgi:N-acetylmuramoyl-L-alanine amidase
MMFVASAPVVDKHSSASRSSSLWKNLGVGCLFFMWTGLSVMAAAAPSKIIDYQRKLNPTFVKTPRKETRFIIIHSTESRLPSALRTLSKGKVRRGHYLTSGGHANYLVARNGSIYLILDPRYTANHAGISLWDGVYNLSAHSIGIELEGYYNVPFSEEQYKSLRGLLSGLQAKYSVEDRDVLEHYRVAYSEPNRYHRAAWRGRKKDPGKDNFDRRKAGLKDSFLQDPDMMAGRVGGPAQLAKATTSHAEPGSHGSAEEESDDAEIDSAGESDVVAGPETAPSSQRIGPGKTAWSIAGRKYNSATTIYHFPDGRFTRGDQIADWQGVPAGTEVQLDADFPGPRRLVNASRSEILLPETGPQSTPWKLANALYNSAMTFYILPDGAVKSGNQVADFKQLPFKTRVLLAYQRLGFPKTSDRLGENLPDVYLSSQTLYLFPDQVFKSGEQIEDFANLPAQTQVFAKLD